MNGLLASAGKKRWSWRGFRGSAAAPPLADAALALAFTGIVQVQVASDYRGAPGVQAVALLITVPLAWRRCRPLAVFLLTFASLLVTARYVSSWPAIAAVLVAAYSVGLYSRHRLLSLGAVVGAAASVDVIFGGSNLPPVPYVAVSFVLLGALWLVGDAMRTRQLRADALADRAARLEREREEATQAALAAERRRLARELHDVVTHSVSVMVVQAGAAEDVYERDPARVLEPIRAVQETGRAALVEMTRLLGLLREDGAEIGLEPQPRLEELPELVEQTRAAGVAVDLAVEGTPRPLPVGIELSLYRVAQEALTNVRKHAAGSRASVTLRYGDADVELRVENEEGRPSAVHSGGHGLVGMRERVAVFGGRLEAGPGPGGFRVVAVLPARGDA
jgi:signal transduction histidine kinase